HERTRHRERVPGQGGPRPPDAGAHHAHHRPPPVDGPRRPPHRGARRGAHRAVGQPCLPSARGRPLPAAGAAPALRWAVPPLLAPSPILSYMLDFCLHYPLGVESPHLGTIPPPPKYS